MEISKHILRTRHEQVSVALHRRKAHRESLMQELLKVDRQIVHLTNEQADLATAMCRLDGMGNTFMPITKVEGETTDPYLPNPFEDVQDVEFSEADGFLLEAADQIGGMQYLDGDTRICAFTRDGLLKLLNTLTTNKRAKKVRSFSNMERW